MNIRPPLADRAAVYIFRFQADADARAVGQIFYLDIFGKRQVLFKAANPCILPHINKANEHCSIHCNPFAGHLRTGHARCDRTF